VAGSLFLPLSDGSVLQLSVWQIVSGRGAPLNRVGVRPDEEVALDLEALASGHDLPLERATAHVRSVA
jgi:C-terminal processing protease CtpA/Prc